MTVKYIAFDGTEFDDEKKCKDYEKKKRNYNKEACTEIKNARSALKKLDDFCHFWVATLSAHCGNCPLRDLCNGDEDFIERFNEKNPFGNGNIDVDDSITEED